MLAKVFAAANTGFDSQLVEVARTIADLDDSKTIGTPHLSEALQYRVQR